MVRNYGHIFMEIYNIFSFVEVAHLTGHPPPTDHPTTDPHHTTTGIHHTDHIAPTTQPGTAELTPAGPQADITTTTIIYIFIMRTVVGIMPVEDLLMKTSLVFVKTMKPMRTEPT